MSRFAPRARVVKRGAGWLVISPSGSKRLYLTWTAAMRQANKAVAQERRYDVLKEMNETHRHDHALDWSKKWGPSWYR